MFFLIIFFSFLILGLMEFEYLRDIKEGKGVELVPRGGMWKVMNIHALIKPKKNCF